MNYQEFRGYYDKDPSELLQGNNNPATKGLFVEICTGGRVKPLYTLKSRTFEKNGIVYPSAYLIYMNSVDEYDAAMKLVGSLDHWRTLCACEWFMHGGLVGTSFDGLIRWREDMEARDRSEAKKALIMAQAEGNVAAARYLHEKSGVVKKAPAKKKRDNSSSSVINLAAKKRLGQ